MTERLLQYIWQLQYFNKNGLATEAGEPLTILHPGIINHNQGPDFTDAKIRVGDTVWAGHIELHIRSSDWNNHKHNDDKNYRNVILHVVWQHDADLLQPFPVLELETRTSKILLDRFDALMETRAFIACEKMMHQVEPLTWHSWKERLLVERLQNRSAIILCCQADNNNHWEETFWWLIAGSFGGKVNNEAFTQIARSLPLSLLARHKNQLLALEALLFGQAGLLEESFSEAYPIMLQREYRFYKTKYQLKPVKESLYFLRMRPSNFPTLRLAQLAMLIHNSVQLFSAIKNMQAIKDIQQLFSVTANDYWHYHYRFDEATAFKKKNLGKQTINIILVNTVLPILFTYGLHHNEPQYQQRALRWMEELAAEANKITNGFSMLNIQNNNAFDSQALLQLKRAYCDQKRCLECAVGASILRPMQKSTRL